MGGAWESLIKSVKSALAIALRNKTLSEEVLRTVLVEVEHSVNSPPLTHISPHPHEKEALTPNHSLFGSSSGQIQFPKFDQSRKCNREDYELSQKYSDLFWSKRLREYLPTIFFVEKNGRKNSPLLK